MQSGKHSLNITKKISSKKHLLPSSKAHCQYVYKLFQLETKQNFIKIKIKVSNEDIIS